MIVALPREYCVPDMITGLPSTKHYNKAYIFEKIVVKDGNLDGITATKKDGSVLLWGCSVSYNNPSKADTGSAYRFSNGACVDMYRCCAENGRKLLTVTGGADINSNRKTTVNVFECNFSNCGKAAVTASGYVYVNMYRSLIQRWGLNNLYNTRCHGVRARHCADVHIYECVFRQYFSMLEILESGRRLLRKIWNTYGMSSLYRSGIIKQLVPGDLLAISADPYSRVFTYNCSIPWWCANTSRNLFKNIKMSGVKRDRFLQYICNLLYGGRSVIGSPLTEDAIEYAGSPKPVSTLQPVYNGKVVKINQENLL